MKQVVVIVLLMFTAVLGACSASSSGTAVTPPTEGSISDRLSQFLEELEADGFRGSVLVDHHGQLVLAQGYGLADEAAGIANSSSTVFDIGSLTKQFTGAAILKLEMAGKLSVDDPLTNYFSNVPEEKEGITLHHLLTHTAGFPDALRDDYEAV